MSKREVINIEHSVHQRLLNKARQEKRPFDELLQHFAMERFLYRLYKSRFRDRFILKGALLLTLWKVPITRPTKDIDFLGMTDNNVVTILKIVKEICRTEVERDGIEFDESTVTGVSITEGADYEGIRVRLKGNLGKTRISLQLDIGFGDIIVPEAKVVQYSSILGFPEPIIRGYSKESTIAEKFEAMEKLGIVNSRLKDFYDIWLISRQFDFECSVLVEAISKTFKRRHTSLPADLSTLIQKLESDTSKGKQWVGFIRKNRLNNAPGELSKVLDDIYLFLSKPVEALKEGLDCPYRWNAPGPWIL
jgi:predicted nucleotidyltransferase component of viral defense system